MSGTDIATGATIVSAYAHAMQCPVLTCVWCYAGGVIAILDDFLADGSTPVSSCGFGVRVSSTDTAYAATAKCPVLTWCTVPES
eukprot:3940488-Rhodomonas_salina.1